MKTICPLAAALLFAACGVPPENEWEPDPALGESRDALTGTCASSSTGSCGNLVYGTACGALGGTCQAVFALGKPGNFCECVVPLGTPPPPPGPTCPSGMATPASCRGVASGSSCGTAGGHCVYRSAPPCNPAGMLCAVNSCSCQ